MADNYLEKHREEYEIRKAKWLAKQKYKGYVKSIVRPSIPRPEDETL